MKARTAIDDAFSDLGIYGAGETADASDMAMALAALNAMIDSWSIEAGVALVPGLTSVPLTVGQSTYTVGPTGGVVAARPALPVQGSFVRYQGVDNQVTMINQQDYNDIAYKTGPGLPVLLYWAQTIPDTTLYVYPVPSQASMVLYLANAAALLTFTTLDDEVAVAPGYLEALSKNLAVRVAAKFNRPVPQSVAVLAAGLKRQLKRRNVQIPTSRIDAALPRRGWSPNILTG